MRIIPKKTNVSMEFFNGFTAGDVAVGFIGAVVEVAILVSNLPGKYYIMAGVLVAVALLLLKMDDERNYIFLLNILRHYAYRKKYAKTVPEKTKKHAKQSVEDVRKVIAWTGIGEGFIHYDKKYYGAVLELPSVEFRFFSEFRQNNAIEKALGGVLRNVNPNYAANLVKLERPVLYDEFVQAEYDKLESLKDACRHRILSEEELKRRIEVIYDRINYLNHLSFENKVVLPFFYLVLFDSDKNLLNNQVQTALELLQSGEIQARRLDDKELAVFLKYSQTLDFDERDIEKLDPEEYFDFSLPENLEIYAKNMVVNNVLTHNFRVVSYPMTVTNAWGAFVFDTPATKVVMKMKPMDRTKSIRAIDRSIDELRSQENNTGKASKLIDISTHIETLSELLVMLQSDSEILMDVNIYVSGYDLEGSMADPRVTVKPENSSLPNISHLKKDIRRIYNDTNMKLNDMLFLQMDAWVAGQVSGYDPREGKGRSIHSSSASAVFPFVYTYTADRGGINLGRKNNIPVFIDFFRRDNERVNSNMAIIGKSGSGKSYATKTLLTNLAAENSKIFVLDPENEYLELAQNLGGKVINVGNATHGRMNPFQIITNLEDDEEGEQQASGVSFHQHLQFLEEFFKQILPDIEPDALEYLNNLIIRIYNMKGIEEHTDLSRLSPEDYPIFDDLYDAILEEFQSTKSDYLRSNLQILINYIAKFSSGGRNSVLWNGYSSIDTRENFIVFNFQSLLANRNNLIANAQMLLVLKWLDNEIIKNRDYNKKYHASRKIVVVIDEAHVFIDTKYPLALDFMFQLAKRIRKYNGMQIVITQNIKDFVGSEEIARKSTAIINACQYSLIFALAPNDMHDLCRLYEKAGQINEQEQEEIINAARGQAFVITSPTNRSSLQVEANRNVQSLFGDSEFVSPYFSGEEGEARWREILEELDSRREAEDLEQLREILEQEADALILEETPKSTRSRVKIVEISEEDIAPPPREPEQDAMPTGTGIPMGAGMPMGTGMPMGAVPMGTVPMGFGAPMDEGAQGIPMPVGNGMPAGAVPPGVIPFPWQGYYQGQAGGEGAVSQPFDPQKMIAELRESLRKELMEELQANLNAQTSALAAGLALGSGVFAKQEQAGTVQVAAAPDVAGDAVQTESAAAGQQQSEQDIRERAREDWAVLEEETAVSEESAAAELTAEEQEVRRMEEEFYQMFGIMEEDQESGLLSESPEELEQRYLRELDEEEGTEPENLEDFENDLFDEISDILGDEEDGESSGETGDVLVWEISYEELMKSA